jgi:hypothetical protein
MSETTDFEIDEEAFKINRETLIDKLYKAYAKGRQNKYIFINRLIKKMDSRTFEICPLVLYSYKYGKDGDTEYYPRYPEGSEDSPEQITKLDALREEIEAQVTSDEDVLRLREALDNKTRV